MINITVPNNVNGTAGSIVRVPVQINELKFLHGLTVILQFDQSKLSLLEGVSQPDIINGTIFPQMVSNFGPNTGGLIYVSLYGPNYHTVEQNGTLFNIDFKIKSDASGTAAIMPMGQPQMRSAANFNEWLFLNYNSGNVSISSGVDVAALQAELNATKAKLATVEPLIQAAATILTKQ